MSSNCIFVLLALLCIGSSYSKKFPSYLTICHRNNPKLEECIKNAVEQLRPHLPKGVPELLLPPMDPLFLPEAGLDSGDNFKASFRNIEVFYADEFKIDRLSVDLDKLIIDLALSFSRLRIKSQYNIAGRILILQLDGHGPADGNLTDISADLQILGQKQQKKGKEYLAVTEIKKLNLNLGKPVLQFENIFHDNKELNDQTNRVINENIVELIEELRPVIEKTVSEFIFGIVGRILNRFSYEELFPK